MVPYPGVGNRGSSFSSRAAGYGAYGGAAHTQRSNKGIALDRDGRDTRRVANAGKIAAVPGVDAVFVGPNDLSHAMGFGPDWKAPRCRLRWKLQSAASPPLAAALASSRRPGGGGPVCRLGRALFRDRGLKSESRRHSEPRHRRRSRRPTLGRRHVHELCLHGLACMSSPANAELAEGSTSG